MVSKLAISCMMVILATSTVLAAELEGPHICSRTQEIPVTIKVAYPVPYEVKTFVWCARIPPRCPKIRTAMKTGYRDETKLTNQTIKVCCEGFAELEGKCFAQEVHYHIGNTTTLRIVKEVTPTEQPGSDAGLWAGISMVLMLVVAAFLFLLMRYKKKLHRVKEELQYVSYTVERTGDKFDNPLYAQAASSISSDYSSTNNFNDLGGTKINNLGEGNKTISGKVACVNYPDEFEPAGAGASASSDLGHSFPKQVAPFNANIAHSRKSDSVRDLSDKEPIYEDIDKYAKPDDDYVYEEPKGAPRPVTSSPIDQSEIYNSHSISSSISANDEVYNGSKSETALKIADDEE